MFLGIIGRSVIDNSRAGNDSILSVQPLLQRAHILVNEIGVLAYKDYTADTEFLGDA